MKDFAKSIRTKNSDPFGVIYREGDFKIKYNDKEKSYELYFQGMYNDTFHTKQQAMDKIELIKSRTKARTGNKATILKDGDVWVVLYANETKSQEFDTEEEAKKFAAKVGNADPRIASLKTKLQNLAKQGDEGAIKDVERFVDDMIKQLNKRKEDLYKEINLIEEDRQGYLDLRGDVMSARYEATHMKK